MPSVTAATINAAGGIDPLNLAILIMGVTILAVIWLAALIIKMTMKKEKK